MKNKEPITAAIIKSVDVRSGVHQHDDQNRTVVEITFNGYSCKYIQVVDVHTARSLLNQLKEILPPAYEL